MTQFLHYVNDFKKYIDPFLSKECFLYFMGGIFLLGIVGQWISSAVYGSLIKKARNMVSTKNKTLKQIKMRFENARAVNGVVGNSTLMVEKYINKYKFMGMTLGTLTKITYRCAVFALFVSGATGCFLYETHHEKIQIVAYVAVGCFVAFALDIYARSVKLERKEGELVCIITDYLENTVDATIRRKERAAQDLKKLEEQNDAGKMENGNAENYKNSVNGVDIVSTDLVEEDREPRGELSCRDKPNIADKDESLEEINNQDEIIRDFLREYFAN